MAELDWRDRTDGQGIAADAGPHGVYTIEPWHDDKQPGQCILKHSSERHLWNGGGTIHKTTVLAKEYAQNIVNDAENPTPRRKGGYTLDDFATIVKGEAVLPNVEEDENGINNIAALGHALTTKWGHSRDADGHKTWTQYFLNVYGGSGWALIYRTYPHPSRGYIVRFAICKHQKKTSAGANPSRGWHPGHCIKCGLDMTVDSGD